jgi:hypothetical protein
VFTRQFLKAKSNVTTNAPTGNGVSHEPKRLRVVDPDDQRTFVDMARRLLDGIMSEDRLRQELGYDERHAMKHAVETGRVSTAQFDRMRGIYDAHMPRHQKSDESSDRAPRRGRATKRPSGNRGRRREFLDERQHARLRERIEHLWAVDRRFRNWALLGRACGLSSGQAAKRAYEVNSSTTTLRNIELFARLFAGFGSRAADALQRGVPIEKLQAFLNGEAVAGAEADPMDAGAGDGRRRRRRAAGSAAGDDAPDVAAARTAVLGRSTIPTTAPADTSRLLGIAAAIDGEMARLQEMIRFFDGLAATPGVPRPVRYAARLTRDHLRDAARQLASDEPQPVVQAEELAPGGAPADDATPSPEAEQRG